MSQALENLSGPGKPLKAEPPDDNEIAGLLRTGSARLVDARNTALALESRFDLAYNAAHALALAALRWHGYRSDNRILVFQALAHTVSFTPAQWRVLDRCHAKRNLAEYEGNFDVDVQLLRELDTVAGQLEAAVEALGPIKPTP